MVNYKKHKDSECSICSLETTEETFYNLSEFFKSFSDANRIKIIYTLFHHELCVQQIADKLNLSQSNVSHQLKILKTAKIVKFRKEGKSIIYSLDDDHVEKIFEQGYKHINLLD